MPRRPRSTSVKASPRRKPPRRVKARRRAAPAPAAGETARLRRELKEAREQQTAITEVLSVMSGSSGELQPVFDAILENATRLCQAKFATMTLYEGDERFRWVAMHNAPPAYAEARRRVPVMQGTVLARMVATGQMLDIHDCTKDPDYKRGDPAFVGFVELAGARTVIGIPLLKDGAFIGSVNIFRQEVRPFADEQIALLHNFAAQAVIAIENARLFNELRQSLDQQTATAEVLRVISSSPAELKPVFDTLVENATRLCGAKFGNLLLFDGNVMRIATMHNASPAHVEMRRRDPIVPLDYSILGPLVRTNKLVHIADISAEQPYANSPLAKVGGMRTALAVPMLKDGNLVGAIGIYHDAVRPFTGKQIALLENFAAQAVIAIENARLLNELRQSLERQTATADVLRVISASPGDLEPVFQTLLENAVRICEATAGNIYRWDDDAMRLVATLNTPAAFTEFLRRTPVRATARNPVGRMQATKSLVHVPDLKEQQTYIEKKDAAIVAAVELGGIRTQLSVPLLKDNEFIGAITLWREEVRPFEDRQIGLVQNFAAQAVIAIENARLLNELRQSLDQQTATADVLRIISASPGELMPVFEAMLENAARICEAKFGVLFSFDGVKYEFAAEIGTPAPLAEFVRQRGPFIPASNTQLYHVMQTRRISHTADYAADAPDGPPARLGGARSTVDVPMLKDGNLVGVISIYRQEVRPFGDKQIALLENFASQAVIAIENARLLNELRQRTQDLSRSLDDLRTTQDRLVQTQKLAELGQLTAGIAHEIKNPLNFVNNFSALSVELIDELGEALARVSADEQTRDDIVELAQTLRGNLDKIAQHGKRADAIVKNMLLHSREGSSERRPVDVNAVVEESLNLAYHGARAEKQGFAITVERSFDPQAGEAHVFPQELTRVLLNLIANGFYAAAKRQATDGGHQAVLTAATKNLGDKVEITIRDNGIGIPPEVKDKIFNPFFTTKPAGEGTGLGLSISHDIVVKQHAGSIEVDSEPGRFTEIKIVLPRAAA
jgi:GAF domain-containing protein